MSDPAIIAQKLTEYAEKEGLLSKKMTKDGALALLKQLYTFYYPTYQLSPRSQRDPIYIDDATGQKVKIGPGNVQRWNKSGGQWFKRSSTPMVEYAARVLRNTVNKYGTDEQKAKIAKLQDARVARKEKAVAKKVSDQVVHLAKIESAKAFERENPEVIRKMVLHGENPSPESRAELDQLLEESKSRLMEMEKPESPRLDSEYSVDSSPLAPLLLKYTDVRYRWLEEVDGHIIPVEIRYSDRARDTLSIRIGRSSSLIDVDPSARGEVRMMYWTIWSDKEAPESYGQLLGSIRLDASSKEMPLSAAVFLIEVDTEKQGQGWGKRLLGVWCRMLAGYDIKWFISEATGDQGMAFLKALEKRGEIEMFTHPKRPSFPAVRCNMKKTDSPEDVAEVSGVTLGARGTPKVELADINDVVPTEPTKNLDGELVERVREQMKGGWDIGKIPPILGLLYTEEGKTKIHIHDGHHRYTAAKELGIRRIPYMNFSAMSPAARAAFDKKIKIYRKLIEHPLSEGDTPQKKVARETRGAPENPVTWDTIDGKATIVGEAETPSGIRLVIQIGDSVTREMQDPKTLDKRIDLDKRRLESRQKNLQSLRQQKIATDTEKAEVENLDDFDEGMSALERGKVIAALNKTTLSNGHVVTRKELIRNMVKGGASVSVDAKGIRRLTRPNGAFLFEKDITKIGMDYAAFLIAKMASGTTAGREKPKRTPVVAVGGDGESLRQAIQIATKNTQARNRKDWSDSLAAAVNHTSDPKHLGLEWETVEGKAVVIGETESEGNKILVIQVGDSLGLSLQDPNTLERRIQVDKSWVESNQKQHKAKDAAKAEKVAARAEAEAVDDFDTGMHPLAREKALKTLSIQIISDGQTVSRKQLIRQIVKDGGKIEIVNGERRLVRSDEKYFAQKDITKIGMDYAAYLIAKRDKGGVGGRGEKSKTSDSTGGSSAAHKAGFFVEQSMSSEVKKAIQAIEKKLKPIECAGIGCREAASDFFNQLDKKLDPECQIILWEGTYRGEHKDFLGTPHSELPAGGIHYWLEIDDHIFDPTAGQWSDYPAMKIGNYEKQKSVWVRNESADTVGSYLYESEDSPVDQSLIKREIIKFCQSYKGKNKSEFMPEPTTFLDQGTHAWVWNTTNPDIVVRVGHEKGSKCEYVMEEADIQETGGVTKIYAVAELVIEGGEEVEEDTGIFVATWKEKVDDNVMGFLYKNYPKDQTQKILSVLSNLCIPGKSPQEWKESLNELKKFPPTAGLAKAIKNSLPTNDLDISANLGVTKDGRIVAYDC